MGGPRSSKPSTGSIPLRPWSAEARPTFPAGPAKLRRFVLVLASLPRRGLERHRIPDVGARLRRVPTEPYPHDVRLLVACLYEIRCVLGHHVGASELTAENEAAAIAYAVHNDALAVLEGREFDVEAARKRLAFWDQRLGSGLLARIDAHQGPAEPSKSTPR